MNQVEVVTGAAQRIIASLQSAIFSSMEAAAENVEMQTKMAAAFQRLEAQEAILDWLMTRRIDQETKLEQADLRPAQKALIRHKIASIDEELSGLLKSAGIESEVAEQAIEGAIEQPRVPKGRPGAGRYLSKNGA